MADCLVGCRPAANHHRTDCPNAPWAHYPEAGPDDWEPCPKCGNMDGGCPFCGHGMIPKRGFKWPQGPS
jgi:hypothetical protein